MAWVKVHRMRRKPAASIERKMVYHRAGYSWEEAAAIAQVEFLLHKRIGWFLNQNAENRINARNLEDLAKLQGLM